MPRSTPPVKPHTNGSGAPEALGATIEPSRRRLDHGSLGYDVSGHPCALAHSGTFRTVPRASGGAFWDTCRRPVCNQSLRYGAVYTRGSRSYRVGVRPCAKPPIWPAKRSFARRFLGAKVGHFRRWCCRSLNIVCASCIEWILIHTSVGPGRGRTNRGRTVRFVPMGTPSKGRYEVMCCEARAQVPKAVAV